MQVRMHDGLYKTLEVPEFHDVCFSPHGRHIAVGTRKGGVLIWNVRAEQLVERLAGHKDAARALAYSPVGAGFTGGCDRTVRYWNIGLLRIDRSGLRDNKE